MKETQKIEETGTLCSVSWNSRVCWKCLTAQYLFSYLLRPGVMSVGSFRPRPTSCGGILTGVHLHYLPVYILVKMYRTWATHLPGLKEQVMPIEPACQTFRMVVKYFRGKAKTSTVQRRQYPMTATYAFTDYRSQGQTIPYVIVDIASPPTGGLNLFNLYVMLSCSSGRESICLL